MEISPAAPRAIDVDFPMSQRPTNPPTRGRFFERFFLLLLYIQRCIVALYFILLEG